MIKRESKNKWNGIESVEDIKKLMESTNQNLSAKEIMKIVWDDIFNNEHCTCRDFEDYWNWRLDELCDAYTWDTKVELREYPFSSERRNRLNKIV